jgi:hypothetical protein
LSIHRLQVAEQTSELLLIGVVILPTVKVNDVPLAPNLSRPRLACFHHRTIKPNRE